MADTEPRTEDWWDRLYDPSATDTAESRVPEWWRTSVEEPGMERESTSEPESGPELVAEPEPEPERWAPRPEPREAARAAVRRGGESARGVAEGLVQPRARWLLYSVPAAAAGWWSGLGAEMQGWLADCGRAYSVSTALLLGFGVCAVTAMAVDARTRHWWPPLAWICHIPHATAVTALLLYAPGTAL